MNLNIIEQDVHITLIQTFPDNIRYFTVKDAWPSTLTHNLYMFYLKQQ